MEPSPHATPNQYTPVARRRLEDLFPCFDISTPIDLKQLRLQWNAIADLQLDDERLDSQDRDLFVGWHRRWWDALAAYLGSDYFKARNNLWMRYVLLAELFRGIAEELLEGKTSSWAAICMPLKVCMPLNDTFGPDQESDSVRELLKDVKQRMAYLTEIGKDLGPFEEEAARHLDEDALKVFNDQFRQFWRKTALHLQAWHFHTKEHHRQLLNWSSVGKNQWAIRFRERGRSRGEPEGQFAIKLLDDLPSPQELVGILNGKLTSAEKLTPPEADPQVLLHSTGQNSTAQASQAEPARHIASHQPAAGPSQRPPRFPHNLLN